MAQENTSREIVLVELRCRMQHILSPHRMRKPKTWHMLVWTRPSLTAPCRPGLLAPHGVFEL